MNKKMIVLLTCATMSASVMARCASSNAETPGEGNAVAAGNGSRKATTEVPGNCRGMVEEMTSTYEKLNPGVDVEYKYVPSDSYRSKSTALNVANELPNVTMTNSQFIEDQMQSGLPVDLTNVTEDEQNYEKSASWGETINPTLLSNYKATLRAIGSDYANKLYGIPFIMTTVAVIYDKNVCKELGLSVSSVWRELEKNCEAIKATSKIPVSMQQQGMDWRPRIFWDQYCREELDANPNAFEDGPMTLSSESAKRGLEKFKYMRGQGWFPELGLTGNRETIQQLLVQKGLVQVMLQPNYLSYLTGNVPEGVELAFYALPGVGGKPVRCPGGPSGIWAVTNSSRHQEEATEFVKFMTSRTAFSEDCAKLINPGLTNSELTSGSEAMQGYIDTSKNGSIPDIYVPVNITTKIQNTSLTDLEPNCLLGTYDVGHVTDQLNQLCEGTYLSDPNWHRT